MHRNPIRILIALTLLVMNGCEPGEIGEIENVSLQANPACAISCVVSWTTEVPASSWVEFGEDPDPTHQIGDEALVTQHRVIVVGMHEGLDYALQALSMTDDGTELRSEPLAFTTGSLPTPLIAGEVLQWDAERAQEGWTLTNLAAGMTPSETAVVMLDMEGEVVWYYQHTDGADRPDVTAYWLDGERLLIGGGVAPGTRAHEVLLDGTVVWEGPAQPLGVDPLVPDSMDGAMHHEFRRLDSGEYLTFQFHFENHVEGDLITLLDSDAEATWTWNAFDWLTPDTTPSEPINGWTHFNSAQVDEEMLYVNSFSMDRIFKIDRDDGHIHWVFGADGDFEPDPDSENPWFGQAHSLERLPGGTWLLYDNGNMDRDFSRIVEYAIDEEAMTSEIVWEYPGTLADDAWYNYAWGDVDLLDNGHLLATAGLCLDGRPSRIWEMDREGTVVWEVAWPDQEVPLGSYAAERIPALAERL